MRKVVAETKLGGDGRYILEDNSMGESSLIGRDGLTGLDIPRWRLFRGCCEARVE